MRIAPVNQWVAEAALHLAKRAGRKDKGQAELARLITKELRRNIDRAAVNKMVMGDRDVTADEMLAIETVSGLAAPSINAPIQVPLIDWVAAGQFAEPMSQVPVDAPRIMLTDLGKGDFLALRVKGDSMDRLCPEGSIIVYNRQDKTLVSGKPYVFSVRGDTSFKLWNAEPGYLDPFSWNPANKPIFIKRKRDLLVLGRAVRAILEL